MGLPQQKAKQSIVFVKTSSLVVEVVEHRKESFNFPLDPMTQGRLLCWHHHLSATNIVLDSSKRLMMTLTERNVFLCAALYPTLAQLRNWRGGIQPFTDDQFDLTSMSSMEAEEDEMDMLNNGDQTWDQYMEATGIKSKSTVSARKKRGEVQILMNDKGKPPD